MYATIPLSELVRVGALFGRLYTQYNDGSDIQDMKCVAFNSEICCPLTTAVQESSNADA
jgi:hypothetical protein